MPTDSLQEDDIIEGVLDIDDGKPKSIRVSLDAVADFQREDDLVGHAVAPVRRHEAEQLCFFPRQEFEHEQAFRTRLRGVLPSGAPSVISVIDRIQFQEDCFIADGRAWDGARLRLELRGAPRRGQKALLFWIADIHEVAFGYDPRAKKWRRHRSMIDVVNSNRCEFARKISLEKVIIGLKIAA